jgi:hypothetical protein
MDMEQRYQLQEEPAPLSEPLTDLASEQHLGSEEGASSETAVDKNAALEATRLTALLHREARIRQKETLVVMAWAAVFFFGMLGIVNRLSSGDSTTFFDTVRLCVGWMIALGLAISVHIGRRSYRRKQALTQALKEIRDVQQVGPKTLRYATWQSVPSSTCCLNCRRATPNYWGIPNGPFC